MLKLSSHLFSIFLEPNRFLEPQVSRQLHYGPRREGAGQGQHATKPLGPNRLGDQVVVDKDEAAKSEENSVYMGQNSTAPEKLIH